MNLRCGSWFNTIQFNAICILMAAIPISWHLSFLAFALLIGSSLIKIIVEKHIGNPTLKGLGKAALWSAVGCSAMAFIGVLYSENQMVGMEVAYRKMIMIAAPLCFLLTDTRYLREIHFRTIFYLLLASIVGLFIHDSITGSYTVVHHSYRALYIVTAFTFVIIELGKKERKKVWVYAMLTAVWAICVLYTIFANSRAGILCMYGVEAIGAIYIYFQHKKWWIILSGILIIGMTFAAEKYMPGHTSRVKIPEEIIDSNKDEQEEGDNDEEKTMEEKSDSDYSDARIPINIAALRTIQERPIFGYGSGDYDTVLTEHYAQYGYGTLHKNEFNAHNQYTETTLATGIVGLMVLLIYLLLPLIFAIKTKNAIWSTLMCTFIVMFNLLFESMLERQMGLQFISLLYAIIVLIINNKENKFV